MDLVIVRHGIAEDREVFARTGKPDEERPLTAAGRKRMRRSALGLRSLVEEIDILASSPLTRAVQTAEILADAFGGVELTILEELVPTARPHRLLDWLERNHAAEVVVVVGHEPHVGSALAWLTSGVDEPFASFKKGGAALIRLAQDAAAGEAELRWLLTAGQLRRLGGC
jgi:phosphohistidine phosphatase